MPNLEDDGDRTLRAAIEAAFDGDITEFDVSGTILLALTISISLTPGDLDIVVDPAIPGPELIWNRRSSDRRLLAAGADIYRIILETADITRTQTDTIVLMP